jgi:hypothetical protein
MQKKGALREQDSGGKKKKKERMHVGGEVVMMKWCDIRLTVK